MREEDWILKTDVTRPKEVFVHEDKSGKKCGRISKVIDDNGDIYYECTACGKRWATGEKATLEESSNE